MTMAPTPLSVLIFLGCLAAILGQAEKNSGKEEKPCSEAGLRVKGRNQEAGNWTVRLGALQAVVQHQDEGGDGEGEWEAALYQKVSDCGEETDPEGPGADNQNDGDEIDIDGGVSVSGASVSTTPRTITPQTITPQTTTPRTITPQTITPRTTSPDNELDHTGSGSGDGPVGIWDDSESSSGDGPVGIWDDSESGSGDGPVGSGDDSGSGSGERPIGSWDDTDDSDDIHIHDADFKVSKILRKYK